VRFYIMYAGQVGCSALHRGSLHTSGCKLHTRPGNPLLGTLPPASDVNGQHPTHRYMRPSPSDSTPGAGCPEPLSIFTIPLPSHSHTPPLPHALPHSTSPRLTTQNHKCDMIISYFQFYLTVSTPSTDIYFFTYRSTYSSMSMLSIVFASCARATSLSTCSAG
jgi:hypothetical protein